MENMKKEICRWRSRIDKIDQKVVRLLNKRAQCVDKIGRIKKQIGINVYSPKREKEVLQNVSATNPGPFSHGAVRRIFSSIIHESRNFEHVKRQKKLQKRKK
jgi:chorismate mutase-like protein